VRTIYLMARPGDTGPYIVSLLSFQLTDYTIDGELITTYHEIEDNDNDLQATPVPTIFTFFSGSAGSGGSDYDGDTQDFFTFDANQNEQPSFYLFYDHTGGAVISVHVRDSEGDLLASTFDNGEGTASVFLDAPLDVDDVAPYFIECSIVGGASDYWLSRSL
jgi:hypothetical protein